MADFRLEMSLLDFGSEFFKNFAVQSLGSRFVQLLLAAREFLEGSQQVFGRSFPNQVFAVALDDGNDGINLINGSFLQCWDDFLLSRLLCLAELSDREEKTKEIEVYRFVLQPLLSFKRLFLDKTAGRVRYHSIHGLQEETMDYLEFVGRATSYIPDKGQIMIRYSCFYSDAHRGKIRKTVAVRENSCSLKRGCEKDRSR
jgi:hypothetical protein